MARKRTYKGGKGDQKETESPRPGAGRSPNEPSENSAPVEQSDRGTSFSHKRIIARMVIVMGTMLAARFYFTPPTYTLASVSETVDRRGANVSCSTDYEQERLKYIECFPKRCGRVVMDGVITDHEAKELLRIARAGLALGGGNGGASILDLHSGALSKGDNFINIYSIIEGDNAPFTAEDFKLYMQVRRKIQSAIAREFGIQDKFLYLTKPTFFSRMDARPARTVHDEYWHPHIDKETYGSFDYTSLLYLSNYGSDFKGGRFVFVDRYTNTTVEPKQGRLSFFTSGSENLHHVEKVSAGVRYAITVSFTCDPSKAIGDPTLGQKKNQ